MSDLIERLRSFDHVDMVSQQLMNQAADEIERLQFALGVCETNRHADAECCDHLERQIERLRKENQRMKPVIDAAREYRKAIRNKHRFQRIDQLGIKVDDALDAYDRSKEQ